MNNPLTIPYALPVAAAVSMLVGCSHTDDSYERRHDSGVMTPVIETPVHWTERCAPAGSAVDADCGYVASEIVTGSDETPLVVENVSVDRSSVVVHNTVINNTTVNRVEVVDASVHNHPIVVNRAAPSKPDGRHDPHADREKPGVKPEARAHAATPEPKPHSGDLPASRAPALTPGAVSVAGAAPARSPGHVPPAFVAVRGRPLAEELRGGGVSPVRAEGVRPSPAATPPAGSVDKHAPRALPVATTPSPQSSHAQSAAGGGHAGTVFKNTTTPAHPSPVAPASPVRHESRADVKVPPRAAPPSSVVPPEPRRVVDRRESVARVEPVSAPSTSHAKSDAAPRESSRHVPPAVETPRASSKAEPAKSASQPVKSTKEDKKDKKH